MANYDLSFPGAAIDAILTTAYDLQNAGYIFKGSATNWSGTPTQRTWLLAPAGFSGYGFSSAIPKGSIGICRWTGSAWVGDVINVVTIDNYPTHNSTNAVTSGGMWQALDDLADGIWDTLQSFVIQDGTTSANQATQIKFDVKMTDGQQVQHLISSFGILAATTAKAGLMSAADKAKVDAFLDNLRSLSFTDTTPGADVGTKIVETLKMTVGGVQEAVTALTILAATTSKAGLMSATDKAYIDGLPASLSTISTSISNLLAMLGYYECSTAAGTAAKTVSASGYVLTTGGCIRIKMTNANTADNVTLNINSTGAKALYYDGAQASSSNSWEAGDILEVFYDGTQYQCASGGGNKAEKIRFNTQLNGLNVDKTNVQDAIDELSEYLERETVLNYETLSYSAVKGYECYITSDNVFTDTSTLSTKPKCLIVPVPNSSCIEITAKSTGCYYAFLKSFTAPASGQTDMQPDFCDGYESRYLIEGNQKKLLFLPNDCEILYIYDGVSSAWRPQLVRTGTDAKKYISINKQSIDDLQIKLSNQQEVIYSGLTGILGYLQDNGTFTPSSTYKCVLIPVGDCLSFSYIAGTHGITYAFLKSSTLIENQRADFVDGFEYVYKDAYANGALKFMALPNGCKYLYVYDGANRSNRPQYISRGYPATSSDSIMADLIEIKKFIANTQKGNSIDNDGRVYPDDVTVLNVERRSAQMLDVHWTALSAIPSTTSATGIAAGEHTGLPYTSCMEVDKFVGFDVTLLTFMTAANNPYSLLYTEDLKIRTAGGHGTSGYGFVYHGTRATIGGYMGIVCNIFALGSIGMEIPFDTGMFAWLAEQGIFTKIYDQSAQGVRIGDIIWEPAHGNIVTDLWRNERGEVTFVDWSESVQNYPITTHMTAAQFNSRLSPNGIIYRYNELFKNIKYTPSPFVAVEGETPQTYVYNDDICTFAGDYACFRVGFPIYINYNLRSIGAWTTMQLYKDDSLLETYNIDASVHRLSLGQSLAAGKYKARLANGTTYSDYTYFEVIQTNVTYENIGDDIKKVTFASSNGTPMYVRCSGIDGAPMCLYPLTADDIANGYCEVNFKSLIQKQYNNLSTYTGSIYCKVTFKGDYGRVTNDPILTDL